MPKKLSKRETYLGNPNLPTADATFEYTPEMATAIEKCKKDILHFAENYFYIVDPDEGKVLIPLFKYQKKLLKSFRKNRYNIVLSSRQSGKCFTGNTKIKIRNKTTGEIEEIEAEKFYNSID